MNYNLGLFIICFVAQIIPALGTGDSFCWHLCWYCFVIPPSFFFNYTSYLEIMINLYAFVRNSIERTVYLLLKLSYMGELANCSTITQSGYWHGYNPPIIFVFLQFNLYLFVCVYLVLCNFITCLILCIHPYSQETDQFQYHRIHFINSTSLLPLSLSWSLILDNSNPSSISKTLSIQKCYKMDSQYIILRKWLFFHSA